MKHHNLFLYEFCPFGFLVSDKSNKTLCTEYPVHGISKATCSLVRRRLGVPLISEGVDAPAAGRPRPAAAVDIHPVRPAANADTALLRLLWHLNIAELYLKCLLNADQPLLY